MPRVTGVWFGVPEKGPPQVNWNDPHSDLRATAIPTVAEDGRIYFDEIRLRGTVVGSDQLRAVPVTAMLSAANGVDRHDILMVLAAHGVPEAVKALEAQDQARRAVVTPKRKPQLRVTVVDGPKPDSFYAAVGRAYQWLVEKENSRRPAAALAEVNGVPVTTVHRWIKEARRRGILGPGVRGRAGL